MSVLLPNTRAGIRRAQDGEEDAYGGRVKGDWGDVSQMYDARTKENADGTWALGVDTALVPVRKGDLIVTEDGDEFLVQSAAVLRNNFDSIVDWVRVTALQRAGDGTEPGGAGFAGREGTSA